MTRCAPAGRLCTARPAPSSQRLRVGVWGGCSAQHWRLAAVRCLLAAPAWAGLSMCRLPAPRRHSSWPGRACSRTRGAWMATACSSAPACRPSSARLLTAAVASSRKAVAGNSARPPTLHSRLCPWQCFAVNVLPLLPCTVAQSRFSSLPCQLWWCRPCTGWRCRVQCSRPGHQAGTWLQATRGIQLAAGRGAARAVGGQQGGRLACGPAGRPALGGSGRTPAARQARPQASAGPG